MLSSLLFAAAFCAVALLVYLARYSSRVRVERTRLIHAPLDAVRAQVADLQRWGGWSPWPAECLLTPQDVQAYRITQRMRLRQPFAVRGKSVWQFSERDGATEVRWSLRARVGFSVRAFSRTIQESLALDMRYGLDQIAHALEPEGATRYTIAHLGVRDVPACRMVASTYTGPIAGLPDAVAHTTLALQHDLDAKGIASTGAPVALYAKTNIKLRTTVCHIGLPVGAADAGELPVRELAAHRAYVVQLQGDPSALELAWYLAMQRMVADNIKPDQRIAPAEHYLCTTPGQQVVELHVPIL